MRGAGSDEGSGGVLALVIVVAAVSVAALVLAGSALLVAHAKTASMADSAALAAATAVAGYSQAEPCTAATQVADAAGGSVASCEVVGTTVTVVCEVRVIGMPVLAMSVAGQPSENLA